MPDLLYNQDCLLQANALFCVRSRCSHVPVGVRYPRVTNMLLACRLMTLSQPGDSCMASDLPTDCFAVKQLIQSDIQLAEALATTPSSILCQQTQWSGQQCARVSSPVSRRWCSRLSSTDKCLKASMHMCSSQEMYVVILQICNRSDQDNFEL